MNLKKIPVFEDGISKEERALNRIKTYVRENLDSYLKLQLIDDIQDFDNVMFIYIVKVLGIHKETGRKFKVSYEYDALNDKFRITDIQEITE